LSEASPAIPPRSVVAELDVRGFQVAMDDPRVRRFERF
jgi:hypothetical protein